MSTRRTRLSPDESRSAALKAAQVILLSDGPQAVTLKAVAAKIGRTHANLLHHFGSAAELQAALARAIAESVTASIADSVERARAVAEAIRFGAKGYLLKDTPSDELAEAIRSIHKGYTQFGPGILEKIAASTPSNEPDQPQELPPGFAELTPRERQVLKMIAAGSSNREIAQALFLSEGTVRNHISHILTRLNLRDRTQAAIVATTFLSWLENPQTSQGSDEPKSE